MVLRFIINKVSTGVGAESQYYSELKAVSMKDHKKMDTKSFGVRRYN